MSLSCFVCVFISLLSYFGRCFFFQDAKGGSNGSRHSSATRNAEQQVAKTNGQPRQKSKASPKQRTPSPTPPSSPVKNVRPVYGSGKKAPGRGESLLLQQQSAESDDDEAGLVLLKGSPTRAVHNDRHCDVDDTQEEEPCDDGDINNDATSETGTYTIGKDSPSPDEDQSRRDIDRVFGLVLSPPSGVTDISHGVSSEATSKWIHDWANQAAQQHQEVPSSLSPLLIQTPVGLTKPPSHPQSHRPPPPELPTTARPRRRLPNVPTTPSAHSYNGSTRSRSSPRLSLADMSDPSDSSLETESFLRDTESVVSAMQVILSASLPLHLLIGLYQAPFFFCRFIQARVDGRSSTESEAETRSSSTSYRPTSGQNAQLPAELENSIGIFPF